jgi:chaperone required for assembly of F1-ATPase
MKRFWSTTRVTAHDGAFAVLLDARPLKLPGGGALSVPFEPLAEAIAAEWAAAPERFTPDDLLCYRAGDGALRATEDAAWAPWTGWAERRFGISLAVAAGIMPVEQSPATQTAFTTALAGMSEYALAGLGVVVPALGSLILGLAIEAGALAPAEACRLAALEELTQEQRWGTDVAAETRRHKHAEDVAESARFMVLCGT